MALWAAERTTSFAQSSAQDYPAKTKGNKPKTLHGHCLVLKPQEFPSEQPIKMQVPVCDGKSIQHKLDTFYSHQPPKQHTSYNGLFSTLLRTSKQAA